MSAQSVATIFFKIEKWYALYFYTYYMYQHRKQQQKLTQVWKQRLQLFFFFTKKSCFENKDRVFCITQNIWKKLGTHVYLILYVYQILKYPSTESFEKNVIWNKKKMNHLNKLNTTLVLQLIAILFKLRCIQIQIWIYTQNGMKQIKILWIHFEFVAVNFHGLSVFSSSLGCNFVDAMIFSFSKKN